MSPEPWLPPLSSHPAGWPLGGRRAVDCGLQPQASKQGLARHPASSNEAFARRGQPQWTDLVLDLQEQTAMRGYRHEGIWQVACRAHEPAT
jgi:hypothetical protein